MLAATLFGVVCTGCGSTKGRIATEQLLASDAVDRAIAQIDFRPLRGQQVYLDTQYLKTDPKTRIGYVDGDYVISTLRQQMIAAGCLLQEKEADAEFVVEARMGTLGNDAREIVYGLPASSPISAAASAASALNPALPPVPTLPEISLARREDHSAAAKIGCFAYHRETGRPVWQSGLAVARSKAKDTYFLGAGPFQKGEIYDGLQFNDESLASTLLPDLGGGPPPIALSEKHTFAPAISFADAARPDAPGPVDMPNEIQQAGHEEPAN